MRDKAIETLQTANEYMNNLIVGIDGIVQNYTSGNEVVANKDMVLLVEGLNWLHQVFSMTKEFHNINEEQITDFYREIVEAMENNDAVLISDLLEYEIKPIIQNWKQSLETEMSKYVS